MKIKGFSDYEIFPQEGRVFSYKSNKYIGAQHPSGYWLVTMYDDYGEKHTSQLHRLIWQAVNGEIPEGYEINHTTEDKNMNGIQHLSLCTHKDNINFGTRNQRDAEKKTNGKLSKQVAAFKNGVLVLVFPSTMEAQRQGYNSGAVSRCCNGKLPHYKGYQWRYLN